MILRQCPLTCGLTTRMTEAGWAKACEGRRKLNEKFAENSADVHVMFCRECQGQIRPPELEIITIEEMSVGKKPSGEKEWAMPADLAKVLRPMSVNEAQSSTIKSLAKFWRRPLIRSTEPSACPCCGGVHRLKNSGICSGCNSDKVAKMGLEGLSLLEHLAKRAKGGKKIKQQADKTKESITPATEPPPPSAHPAAAGAVDVVGPQVQDCLDDVLTEVGRALQAVEKESLTLVAVRRMGELAEARDTIRLQVEMIGRMKQGVDEVRRSTCETILGIIGIGNGNALGITTEEADLEAITAAQILEAITAGVWRDEAMAGGQEAIDEEVVVRWSGGDEDSFAVAIARVCDQLREFLLAKNAAYGNSAADPLRVFSKASPVEQINVRIDDKLSRMMRGATYPGDDDELDLVGYLLLKRAVLAWHGRDVGVTG